MVPSSSSLQFCWRIASLGAHVCIQRLLKLISKGRQEGLGNKDLPLVSHNIGRYESLAITMLMGHSNP